VDTTVWTRAVATRALRRGDTLRAADFALVDTLVQRRPPFGLDTATPQAGWLVQRPVAEGEWLRRPAVTPMPAVTAGQPVQAYWTDGTVHLAVNAIALNTAPIGAAVSVRVGRTRRLDGIVIAPDSVRLR
jgi:flagella basal body P-ring formation protein FlgA